MKKMLPLVAVLTLLALSCGDEEDVTPPPPAHTPADVIESVEISFNKRDIETLKKSLSRDFVFYFDPDDVGQNPARRARRLHSRPGLLQLRVRELQLGSG